MSRWVSWVCCQALRLASPAQKKKRQDVNHIDCGELFSRVYILGIGNMHLLPPPKEIRTVALIEAAARLPNFQTERFDLGTFKMNS